ncbi:uncharacterized protein [Rhodnius prolixus]|uniref:uncharacterized protein n=1 Tax=Rhodnius prolixus TaxID=13249 RepID=UPI003D18B235
MVSEFPYYDEEDPDLREIVWKVDELVLCKQQMRCHLDEIIRRGRALEQIMLRHQERLMAEHKLIFWLKIGQLFSMTWQNKQPAIDALSKVIMLDARVSEAWDTLADIYTEIKDYPNAEFCLVNSLRLGRKKVPLRNMSVICRKLSNKYPDKKFSFLQRGLNLAKEAVDKDVKDGISWGILGNAYLSAHLNIKKDILSAKLALSAYKQAINLGITYKADIFFYLGYVLAFCDFFKEALLYLDKSIFLDKDEEQPINYRNALYSFLNNIQNSCSTMGKLTPKRLAKLRKGLKEYDVAPMATLLKAKPAGVSSLKLGENPDSFLYGKVVWCSPARDGFPLACGCMDASGQLFVLTIHNLTPGITFFVGELITVPKPEFKFVYFKYYGQYYEFSAVRVDNPTALFVNQEQQLLYFYTSGKEYPMQITLRKSSSSASAGNSVTRQPQLVTYNGFPNSVKLQSKLGLTYKNGRSFSDYDGQDPEVSVIEEEIGQLHISPPDEAQMVEDNNGVTVETVSGDKLMPICRLVDDLVKCYEEGRCQHDDIVKRGEALEEIMLIHEDNLIRENEFLFLLKIGQLYSMIKKHKLSAIDALSVVVEHDPNVAEAWDALADCYWEMKDYHNAQICLANSLRKERRKVSLRNMSVICRKLATKYPDKESSYLQTGISLAKEAVEKDIKDGISWGILGNVYLSAHLKLKKDMKCAKLALSAFNQAVKNGNTVSATLHFHHGYVNVFCENYEEALTSLDNAIALEKVGEQAVHFRNALLTFLTNVQNLCSSYGSLNPKRLAKLQKDLQKLEIAPIATSLGSEPTSVRSLQLGENPNMFVYGKVIWSLFEEDLLPFACGCIDVNGEVFLITSYNLTGEWFFVGDIMIIPIVDYKTVSFVYNDQLFEFRSLRVDKPTELLVNRQRLRNDYFSQL